MKQHLLLVDDEPQIRELLSLYFQKHGYAVSTAADSNQALETARRVKPDLAVLDIGLAEEDGLKVLARLKTEHPNLRVVMLTGMGFVEDLLLEAQQKGADGYVSKVLPMDELLAAVKKLLEQPRV